MGFPLTDQQRRVVEHRQGALLVSAAAGSGKTRVLVERLLDRVIREERDLDEFLVITYTKAAAAELRARIAQELSQRLGEEPGNRHLRRQATLVYRAQISTVHAFCAQVLRESGHLIALPADFRLCDEGEAVVLMQQVLGDVMDRRYEQMEQEDGFSQLVDTLSAGRDDTRLEQIVLDVLGRMQSHADPDAWLKAQVSQWQAPQGQDMAETPWGALLLNDAQRQGEYCLARMARALDCTGRDAVLCGNYAPSISETMGALERLVSACNRGWDQAAACFPIPFPPAGRKKGAEDERAGAFVKAIRTRCKKQMDKLAEGFGEDSALLSEDMRQTFPVVKALALLVQDVSRAYGEEKRRRGVLDFSDLEHLALKLLTDEGGGHSPLARLWSSRFAQVMVDEYQDTNQVQDAIFTAVSENGRKLFMVGDVKQSIYRFRLADPTIFLDKYRRFQADEGEGRALALSQNFRSRPQVLEGCNDLFRALMTREFGEVDYTGDQALVPGAVFPAQEGMETELRLLDLSYQKQAAGEKRESKDFLEARHCAQRVKELLEKPVMVSGEDGQRPLEPGDVLILLRSPGTVLPHYLRAFGERGIPVAAEGGGDLFAATETNVALAILQLADNPRQDVSLVAALRSPVFGFTEDDLARLRSDWPQGDLYAAVEHGAQEGNAQCQAFLAELAALRFGAWDMTARELVWHIYEKTNLLGIFGAMEGGEVRRENLLALYHLAAQLESGGCRSLFQFLLRLDRMRETGKSFPTANPSRQIGGVSIMSIHRSKGLERPVVMVCGLSRRLNRDDLMRPVLFHPKLGFGPKGLDQRRMVEYPTLARRAVARQLEKEMYAEELRLLYVAMTRAREKLILSVALTEGGKALERLGEELGAPPSPMALEQQSSVAQWILLHALTRPEAEGIRTLFGLPEVEVEGLGPRWDIRLIQGEPQACTAAEGEQAEEVVQSARACDLEALAARLAWSYPHAGATQVPSKVTVTQLKGREVDREAAEEAEPAQPLRWEDTPLYRPDFMQEQRGLTPAQRGTALHLAMQYLPLGGDHSPQGVQAELDRLVAGGFLTPLQAQAAQPRHLSAFLTSPLGQAVAHAKVCRREFKFSLLVPAADYLPLAQAGEEILLQGVIDCWFENADGVAVLDFKSDRVKTEEAETRAEEYRVQLEGYARALEEILGRPVRRKIVWFFSCDRGVELA